ncbi:unnamed protein product [Spodoptera littoralis]|uniref:Kazal-like domain-containing protein n=1 Tax=Spodoptera littoralis TaxID=7109 RepID=A0A9P0N2N3_SPOLI|nr:unnamed protein product [Spodoptera littoralis]CAH1639308.1 unnamed protein product [Spodoptera littoralis]
MYLTVGIIITASVLLAVLPGNNSSCTSFSALADPCGCTISKENFDPICGSDGGTYLNECFLECEKTISHTDIKVNHKGVCQPDSRCSCHARYEPVCATNGVTYSNECVLECNRKKDSSISINHKGECPGGGHSRLISRTVLKTCTCNPASGPICATNGITYPNYCVMRCDSEALDDKSIDFDHWGVCISTSREQQNYKDPKNCKGKQSNGNDNRDDPNEHVNMKEPQDSKGRCTCAAVHKPVCATDHNTYANVCVLHCHAKKDSSIKFLKMGDCSGSDPRLVTRYGGDDSILRMLHFRRAHHRRNNNQR